MRYVKPQRDSISLIRALATCIADQKGGALLDLPHFNLEVLDNEITGTKSELRELETLHKGLIMYMWLSFRFPGVFTTRPLANHVKELVENAIEKCLRMLNFQDRAKARKRLRERGAMDEISADLLKQEWVQQAAAGVGQADDGRLVDGAGGLETGRFREDTAMKETVHDDEGEYPEEDDVGDEGSTRDELHTFRRRRRQRPGFSVGTGDAEPIFQIRKHISSA
jgi:ATP-dependent RNA helicase SUPV3L1/SUV3